MAILVATMFVFGLLWVLVLQAKGNCGYCRSVLFMIIVEFFFVIKANNNFNNDVTIKKRQHTHGVSRKCIKIIL
jgi:uncharacterized membrane protein